MQIKNTGLEARSLSLGGVNVPLLPGGAIDAPITEDEAEAYRGLGFEVTGQAEPAKTVPAKAKE